MPEPTTTPEITLGGQTFRIPRLALRQIKIVVPAIQRFRKANMSALTQDDVETLRDIAFNAILRDKPDYKIVDFENLPVSVDELMQAVPIIAPQAGMIIVDGGGSPSGEAKQPETKTT